MIVSNKQIILLVSLLQSSLTKNIVGYLNLDVETRARLLNDILNQQDIELKELDKK